MITQLPIAEREFDIAFTQTIYYTNDSYIKQFNDTLPILRKSLSKIGPYIIYPEFTLQGVIHYHGSLIIEDKVEYFKQIRVLRSKLGHNLFKYIDNTEKWKEYIQKDKLSVSKMLYDIELPILGDRIITLEEERKKII